jgi:hypothetical protein
MLLNGSLPAFHDRIRNFQIENRWLWVLVKRDLRNQFQNLIAVIWIIGGLLFLAVSWPICSIACRFISNRASQGVRSLLGFFLT